jgi:MscS family membrane protein
LTRPRAYFHCAKMKRLVLLMFFVLATVWPLARADNAGQAAPPPAGTEPGAAPAAPPEKSHATSNEELKREGAAATVLMHQPARPAVAAATGLIDHLVDLVLGLFDVDENGNALAHYAVSAFFLLLTLLLRRVVTAIIFNRLRKLAAHTKTTLDDRLLPALAPPTNALVGVIGILCALDALKLSDLARHYTGLAAAAAFSTVFFWAFLRALNALLDHAQEVARTKNMGVAAFMPWIKKTVFVVFAIFGALIIAQSLGADVKAFLAGLGIGGLAFALAAQDTIANLFGSVVVAIDQPFKIGEAVQIGSATGLVEDIGLRSTKIRATDKSLVIVPNKTVAAETITNLSRFTQRRVEQIISLTYDTTPDKMMAIVEDIRQLILREEEVDPSSVMVYFRDYSASSLDIWLVYMTKGPDLPRQLALRERLNLAIMKAVAARGLAFAFPTSVMHLDGPVAKALAKKKD